MRFRAILDQINNVDRKIEGLRLDMQAAIHNEFMFLVQKMLLHNNNKREWCCTMYSLARHLSSFVYFSFIYILLLVAASSTYI
jgi:hypothetical protein